MTMRKSLPMYLAGMVLVFALAAMMYGVAERASGKVVGKDVRIRQLEEELSRCIESAPEPQSCAEALQEAEVWKGLAEQCVEEKLRVKAR